MPAVLAIVALFLAPMVAATDIDERATMDRDGRVTVINVAGSVEVVGWDSAELVLTGTLSEMVDRLDFEASSGDVRIEVVYGKRKGHGHDRWGHRDMESHLKLKVPQGSRLVVATVSADVDVRDHLGTQELESVSGDIEATLGEADADIESVSGSIELTGRDVDISLDVDTVSGDLTIRNLRGNLDAEAVSGDIEVRNSRLVRASFDCVSGDIEFDGKLASNGRLEMETVSGDVSLNLEGNVDARFRIDSHSGDIDAFYGNKPERVSRHGPGETLKFSVGSGNAEVRITTLSGDVRNRGGARR